MNVTRFDLSDFKAVKTDEGFLIDSPVVGRIGIQEYRRADGTIRRELRLPEEVFNADSLASFVGKPITVDHPKAGKVTSKDAHRVTVGTMLAAGRQDGETVKTDIVIHSPDTIGDRRQLSLGYSARVDETPGVWNGQEYDAIQRDIRINHLSVVKIARAGAIARLNLDSMDQDFFNQQEHQTMSTVKVKLDTGLEYDAAPEVVVALDKLRADASAAAEKLKAIPVLQAERDTLQSRVDGIKAEIDTAKAAGKAEALARVKLEGVAQGFKVDCADKTDRQIKEAVILAVRKDAKLEGKEDTYIDAAFDMAVEMKGDVAMAAQRQAANTRTDGKKELTSAERRQAMIDGMNKKEGE